MDEFSRSAWMNRVGVHFYNEMAEDWHSSKYQNAYEKTGWIFKQRPSYSEMPNRTIVTNVPDLRVCDNSIRTYKYTYATFLPLNLLVQFSKLPNLYFLIIGLMQMLPLISVSGGFPAIYIPLGFVVLVSAVKDFFEDLKRKQSDQAINSHPACVLTASGFEAVSWQDIHIGDVVKVSQNEQFPADLILLQSSQERLHCFIETKNLDGETNLKQKQVKFELGKTLAACPAGQPPLHSQHLQFNYERPNPFIYSFTGSWNSLPLDCNNVVLRGCTLKITKWVTGVVVYSGVDSKIMLNGNKSRQKKSRLEFRMGLIVIIVFIIQMLLTFCAALASTLTTPLLAYELGSGQQLPTHKTLLIKWGSWILLFTNFVPISLIVSLEMVKYVQGTVISSSAFRTTQPAEVAVQTSTLNEELGQIQHLFSDKTGTLTKNYMSFKYLSMQGKAYGYDRDRDADHSQFIANGISNVDFHDQQFMQAVQRGLPEAGSPLEGMMVSLALCHNVIIEEDSAGNKRFNASSPDELAFINMAKHCGWQFQGLNTSNELWVQTPFGPVCYKILHTIEFDSDRKRMSVILEKDQRIYVYCKGADNVMLTRAKTNPHRDYLNDRLTDWSKAGLRTLVFARREINRTDYDKWAKMYAWSLSKLEATEKEEQAKLKRQIQKMSLEESRRSNIDLTLDGVTRMVIDDGQAQNYNEPPQMMINRLLNESSRLTEQQKSFIQQHLDSLSAAPCSSGQLEDMLEREFQVLGATAIEDQLQDNVKETIQLIREAGVKVWMLTGDKKQTAINIGHSCGLLSSDMAVVEWTHSVENTIQRREEYGSRECCLVATGEDLLTALDQKLLLGLVQSCQAIICCRVSPKQKQDMVWLMRKNKFTTLGIGDGANDVNMINTAHVGVGIKGVQGAQAALCSDYAISEFQILRELMLYHGRESYRKNSQLILFNFYKNLMLSLPQLWYGFYNNFSSVSIYDPFIYQMYNVLYTAIPIVVYAVLDHQYSVDESLKNPQLYRLGLYNELFRPREILLAFWQSVVDTLLVSYISWHALEQSLMGSGTMINIMGCGMCIFAQVVVLVNLKVIVLSFCPSRLLYASAFGGIALYFLFSLLVEPLLKYTDYRGVIPAEYTSSTFWMTLLAGVSAVLVIELIKSHWRHLLLLEQKKKVQFAEVQIELPLIQ